jgi:hypothetical protein
MTKNVAAVRTNETITYDASENIPLAGQHADVTAKFFQKKLEQVQNSSQKNDWKRKSDELNIMVKQLASLLSDLGLLMAEINQELGLEKSIPTQEISESLVKIGTQINKLPTEIEKLEANIAKVGDSGKRSDLESKLGIAKNLLDKVTLIFNLNRSPVNDDDEKKEKSNVNKTNSVINKRDPNATDRLVTKTDGDDDGDDEASETESAAR